MRQFFNQRHPWITQAIGGLIAVIAIIPIAAFMFISVINAKAPEQAVPPLAPPSTAGPVQGAQTPTSLKGSRSTGSNSAQAVWTDAHMIFAQNCTPCHIGQSTGGLNLDTYANAMKGGSTALGGVVNGAVIKPGNAGGSYLYQAITGKQKVGLQMPLGRAPLPQTDIQTIFKWIQGGAKQ